ncbi:MAG: group I intron-associated PD-(D/E)XK endonuclease [Candidatus Nanohaloarchaea archaeon]
MKTLNPKRKGEISEAVIISELMKKGLNVSLPFGENTRYDLILDNGDKLQKIQCKTGSLKNGVVVFNTVSTTSNYSETSGNGYDGEIDKFVVYCPDNEELYSVPIEDASNSEMKLRIEPPGNGQKKGINWAEDYKMGDNL